MLRGCRWAFALLALEIGATIFMFGPRVEQIIVTEPYQLLCSPVALASLKSHGWSAEMVERWVEIWTTWQRVLAVVYPAFCLILAALVVLANAALLRTYLARRDPGWLDGGEFEGIRWPFGLAVGFTVSGLSLVSPAFRPVAYNALLVLGFFFALQGLAIVAYYVHRLAGPPFLRLAVFVLVLLNLANSWAPPLLALLGLFDVWFNFRRWAEPPTAEAP